MDNKVKLRASLVAQMVKNPPAMQETQVRSLGWEDPWRRKWQLTPGFLPGESHGQRSLVGYSPWAHKESDMTNTFDLNYWLVFLFMFQLRFLVVVLVT